jgi:hypothetical protein
MPFVTNQGVRIHYEVMSVHGGKADLMRKTADFRV